MQTKQSQIRMFLQEHSDQGLFVYISNPLFLLEEIHLKNLAFSGLMVKKVFGKKKSFCVCGLMTSCLHAISIKIFIELKLQK